MYGKVSLHRQQVSLFTSFILFHMVLCFREAFRCISEEQYCLRTDKPLYVQVAPAKDVCLNIQLNFIINVLILSKKAISV